MPRRKLTQPKEEWLAGRFSPPALIHDQDPPYHPEVILWMADGLMLHSEVCHPREGAAAVARALREAMAHPLASASRRPARVRVADGALVPPIRAVLGEEVAIHVAPVPELTQAADMLTQSLRGYGTEAQGPLYAPEVADDTMAGFHRAAARLFQTTPWSVVPSDSHVLGIDAPALGLRGGVLCVIGQIEESYGLLLFPSMAAYVGLREMGEAAAAGERPGRAELQVFSINFERGAELPSSLRREIAKKGWDVAGPEAYPVPLRLEGNRSAGPAGEEDVRLAWALCAAAARFIEEHARRLMESWEDPVMGRYVLDEVPGVPAVTLTAPHPDAEVHGLPEPEEGPYDELIFPFLAEQEEAGRDAEWLADATLLCNALCSFQEHQGLGLRRWTVSAVEEFLDGVVPSLADAGEVEEARVPEILDSFFAWLAAQRLVPARTTGVIRRRLRAS